MVHSKRQVIALTLLLSLTYFDIVINMKTVLLHALFCVLLIQFCNVVCAQNFTYNSNNPSETQSMFILGNEPFAIVNELVNENQINASICSVENEELVPQVTQEFCRMYFHHSTSEALLIVAEISNTLVLLEYNEDLTLSSTIPL
ncbi:MAG: hypothetical protein HRT74_13645, partial [Flavobacteriales bacterium]|nr:hypothetical protein [Flavobacteriales bacterium]